MKPTRRSFYLGVMTAIAPSLCYSSSLMQRFEQYPSPAVSAVQKNVSIAETVGAGTIGVISYKFSKKNDYKEFRKALDEYQDAVRDYENAGGTRVQPGDGGVAVLLDEPSETTSRQARTSAARARREKAARVSSAKDVKEKGGEKTATAEAKATGEGATATATGGGTATAVVEEEPGKLAAAAGRIGEGLKDQARHSEALSRLMDVGPEGDDLTRASAALDQARLRLKATVEKMVAREGVDPKPAFVKLKESVVKGEKMTITSEVVQEARSLSSKITAGTTIGMLGGFLLTADGIYRLVIVNNDRNPKFFPLGRTAVDVVTSPWNNE